MNRAVASCETMISMMSFPVERAGLSEEALLCVIVVLRLVDKGRRVVTVRSTVESAGRMSIP